MLDFKYLIKKHHIEHVTINSQHVKNNSLFIALKGNNFDGNDFINQALKNGSNLIFGNNCLNFKDHDNIFHIENLEVILPEIVNFIYTKKPQNIISVTGTNGKSSITDLLRQAYILLEKNIATIGTIGVYNNEKLIENLDNTTPDICKFYQLLDQNYNHDFVFEASSHGLAQNRFGKVNIDIAIFTNLSRDHLDYHKDMNDYFNAKLKLFTHHLKKQGVAIINIDDVYGKKIIDELIAKKIKFFSYGKNADNLKLIKLIENGFIVQFAEQEYLFKTKLIGEFQIYNILAVISVLLVNNINMTKIIDIVANLNNIKGRLEEILHQKKYRVFVDYAHTPDALKNVLITLRKNCLKKLILIFGCGGNRDQGKRKEMAEIANQYADINIVTDDNPRNENANLIRAEICKYLDDYYNIADRKDAMQKAIDIASSEDIIIIAGKGHENYQIIGDKKINFDDYQVMSNILQNN